MTERGAKPGALTGAFALFALATLGGEIALAVQGESLMLQATLDERFARTVLMALAAVPSLLLLGGVALLVRARRMASRSPGRARVTTMAVGAIVHAVALGALVALGVDVGLERALESGLGVRLPPEVAMPAEVLSGVALTSGLVLLIAAISCWFLQPAETRSRLWWVIDAALVVAVGYALWRLPADPPVGAPRALALPVLRHVLVTAGLLRLTVRLMPWMLNGIEGLGFEPLVAARHLRAKKSGFLAAISLLSVLAVTVSCIALTLTLSIMGGFRNDLKRKILGNNAHIVVDRDHRNIEGWAPMLKTIDGVPRVTGASPYVRGEVMLSSASNLATAVLRGIDPATIGKVNDLPSNMRNGSLDYLTDPEKLLELPPDRFRSRLMPLLGGEPKDEAPAPDEAPDVKSATGAVDAGALAVGAGAVDGGAFEPRPATGAELAAAPDAGVVAATDDRTAQKLRIEQRIDELERFMRNAPADAPPEPQDRDVLPGIVIGQELARALRLFVGDEVNVVAPLGALGPSGPMPKARAFRVAGVFYSGMYEYDMKHAYVSLATAQQFLGVGDAISGVEVRVSDVERAPVTAAAIRGALGDRKLRVRDWQELNSRLFGALALEKLAMFIALGIAILVASFCIAGTLTLMVQEKGREVAILKAMGTPDRAVVGVFVVEGGLIGLLGAGLGLFLGYMLCFAAEHFGIRMNPEVYYIDRLPVHVDPTEFALTGVAAVGVCLLVTVYPALLASRLRPVDALRYE